MPVSPEAPGRKLGRLEKVFFLGLALYWPLRWAAPASPFTAVFPLALYLLGVVLLFRFSRVFITRVVWRLRNRLIIAYLFIAVVPVVLIVALAGLSIHGITGQMASYIINAELERRNGHAAARREFAGARARARTAGAGEAAGAVSLPYVSERRGPRPRRRRARYPASNALAPPPEGWQNAAGVVVREGRIYCWAHAVPGAARATITAPLTHEFLAGLASGLGSISLVATGSVPGAAPRIIRLEEAKGARRDRIPPRLQLGRHGSARLLSFPDHAVGPAGRRAKTSAILVQTRFSAVFGLVLGHNVIMEKFELWQFAWWLFLATSGTVSDRRNRLARSSASPSRAPSPPRSTNSTRAPSA